MLSAINLGQVELVFNKTVDKADAEDTNNYTITGYTVVDAELMADEKTVVLTVDVKNGEKFEQQQDVEVKVGSALVEQTLNVTAFDVTIPNALKVEQAGPYTVKVTFSEPVQTPSVANFKFDDGEYFINGATIDTNVTATEVTFELFTTIPEGSHNVTVKGVKDLNDYSCLQTDLSFVAFKDEVAPYVTEIIKATPEQVVLEFSEDITLVAGAAATDFYHTNSQNIADADFAVVNGNQLKLNFVGNNLPQGIAYLYISGDIVEDKWGNKNDEIKGMVINVTVDTVKPAVKNAESETDTEIVITYTEDIETLGTYKVLDSTGEEITAPSVAAEGTDGVKLTWATALSGSTYTVVIEGVKDAAGNEIDKVSVPVAVTDSTPPTVTTTAKLYTSKKIVKISFSEAINSSELLDLSNYLYVGVGYLEDEEVTASITDNGKAVLLDFSESEIAPVDGNTIQVAKVHDLAGNATESFATTVTLADQDATGIGVEKVEVTDKKTVKITLADALASFEADDFALSVPTSAVRFTNVDGKGVITYTLIDELKTTGKTTADTNVIVTTAVAIDDINSANAYGVKVAAGLNLDIAQDKVAPEFDTVAFTANNVIAITFTEAIKADTISKYTFTVSGNTVDSLTYDPATLTATITLEDAVADNTEVTVTQVLDIEDTNDNVATGLTADVTYTP